MADKNKKPIIDCGHYVDIPPVTGERTVTAGAGTAFSRYFVLGSDGKLPFDNILLEKDSSANVCVIVLPGVSADFEIGADFLGENASLTLSGIYISSADEKVSIRTSVRHRVPHCTSLQLFNGIAGGTSEFDFYGKIVIAPDAQKIEAFQTNRNILFSQNAKVDTKPQLEIYADDVKCSHGATIGKLNEDEQFYMRSRGIPEAEAKVLQMISFLSPVLEYLPENERGHLHETIERAVRSLI